MAGAPATDPSLPAPLHSSPLAWTATIVRCRCYIADRSDHYPRCRESSNGSFSAGTRTSNKHLDLTQALIHTLTRGRLCRLLSRESCGLSGSFESNRTRAAPCNRVALRIGQRYHRVVKCRLNVGAAHRDIPPHSPSSSRRSRHLLSSIRLSGSSRLVCGPPRTTPCV